MSARTLRRRRPAVAVPEWHEGQLLDWTSSEHWARDPQPCRYCGRPTNLRDSKRKAAHKTCAEEALTQQSKEAADEYLRNR